MLIQWLFDKIGYMPKMTVETEISAWPFPLEEEPVRKQAKKAAAKKPAAKKTTRKTVRKKA